MTDLNNKDLNKNRNKQNNQSSQPVRAMCLQALVEINEKDAFCNVVVKRILDENKQWQKADRAFFTRVCEGTCERMITLDYRIDRVSKVHVKKMKPVIRNLMRMSAYQILFMDRVPDSAVCNEAVKLAKKRGFQNLAGFVNGVLRTLSRTKDETVYPPATDDAAAYLSVAYSCPKWIAASFLSQFGLERTEELLKAQLSDKPLSARLIKVGADGNEMEMFRSDVLESLKEQQIEAKANPLCADGILIYRLNRPEEIREFAEGKLYIQDTSSMLAMQCAGIKEGDCCLDVCAAPGGKSVYAATKCGAGTSVRSRDVSDEKTALIRENADRLHLLNITAQTYDAAVYDADSKEAYDVVIADLPCSGLGVMGRKSDIKYKTKPSDVEALAALQKKILDAVCGYVRPGGVLLYSTCTIHPAENVDNVRYILEKGGYVLESLEPYLPKELCEGTTAKDGYLQLLSDTKLYYDGFFFARFRRVTPS